MTKKNKRLEQSPKPLLDVLFAQEEGYGISVKLRHELLRKGDSIVLVTTFSPKATWLYRGEIEIMSELLKRESRILKPNEMQTK